MGSDKPERHPETPMLIPGKVEDFVNKYIAPRGTVPARRCRSSASSSTPGRTSGKAYETPVSSFRKGRRTGHRADARQDQLGQNVLAAGEADVKLPKGRWCTSPTRGSWPSAATPRTAQSRPGRCSSVPRCSPPTSSDTDIAG